jgi:hypothetical protein
VTTKETDAERNERLRLRQEQLRRHRMGRRGYTDRAMTEREANGAELTEHKPGRFITK